ncbi:hypothetical protein [Brevundimonas sp.]|uniref:hypothetical protein n=1 Tax=Brevundimonas sp. TaxID=1871086 RepID=UPI003D6D4CF9
MLERLRSLALGRRGRSCQTDGLLMDCGNPMMSEPRFRTREIVLILAVAVAGAATLLGLMVLIFGFGLA